MAGPAPKGLFSRFPKGVALRAICQYYGYKMRMTPKGPQAARLRQRRAELIARFQIPADPLPGSLVETRRRCGKPNCHCARGEGHPVWVLTYMVGGQKRAEHIPRAWVEEVQRRVAAGRAYKEAVAEVFAANAELLVLWRKQRPR